MAKDSLTRIFTLICGMFFGGGLGFVLGLAAWMAFYYLVFILPRGLELSSLEGWGTMTLITGLIAGPLGAIIGMVVGVKALWRFIR